MKSFLSPAGEYQEHGSIEKKSFYTFFEILKPPAEDGIYVIFAWARWDTDKNKGWRQRPPADKKTKRPQRSSKSDNSGKDLQ